VARLATGIWVAAYRARLRGENIPCYITAKGDETAGAVLVKCATLDGKAVLWQRSVNLMSGERTWMALSEGAEPDVDAAIQRQRGFDPDVWVIEIEERSGRTLLDQPGLE